MNPTQLAATLFLIITCSGCSFHAEPAPSTSFLAEKDLSDSSSHLPWNASWIAPNKKVMEPSGKLRKMYISPVSNVYLNSSLPIDKRPELKNEDIDALTTLLHGEFVKAIGKNKDAKLVNVDEAKDADLILELALTELTPTKTGINAVTNIGAIAVPGSKAVQGTVAVAAPGAGGVFSAGTVALEMKIVERKTQKIIGEAKDRQSDPASVLPNYRDFQAFGWSRETVRNWADQFAETFSTDWNDKVDPSPAISIFPW